MSRKKQNLKLMNPNPSRVLRLFAETQDRLYDGDTIKKMISQIAKHTKDRKIIVNCEAIADLLQLEFDQTFLRNDVNQHNDAVRKLQNHVTWVHEKYKEVKPFLENCDPIWHTRLQEATDAQLARLSQLVSLLSAVPDICDLEGNSDLAPFLKESSRNGFENNFKTITSSNISINLDVSEKFQPKNRSE
jgi:hypothetical protein